MDLRGGGFDSTTGGTAEQEDSTGSRDPSPLAVDFGGGPLAIY